MIFIISSCQKDKISRVNIENSVELKGTTHPEFKNLLLCNGILLDEDLIIINDWSSDSGFFHVFNYYPIEKRMTFSKKGKGPGEFITPFFCKNIISSTDEISFTVYDLNLKNYVDYSFSNVDLRNNQYGASPIINTKRIPTKIFPSLNITYFDSCYYGTDLNFTKALFYIFNLKTEQQKWVDFIPHAFYKRNRLKNKSYVFENRLVVNKDKGRISVGMTYFNQVHFFDLSGTHIKSISIGEDILPTLRKNKLPTNESRRYCFDLYATNDYVYVLWGGQLLKDYKSNTISNAYVIVFNWEGEYIKTFNIGMSNFISVNPQNTILVASGISLDGTSSIATYDIEN